MHHRGPILEAANHLLILTGVSVLRVLIIFWISLLIVVHIYIAEFATYCFMNFILCVK